MHVLRTLALGATLVIGGAVAARAQSAPPAPAPRDAQGAIRERGGQLAGLELTAEQKAKLEAISVKYARENTLAREAMASDPADAMRKMMALRDKMVPEFRAVLTAPQQAIFDRNMAEMKLRMDARLKP